MMVFKKVLILQVFLLEIRGSLIDAILTSCTIETITPGELIEQYTLEDKHLLFFSHRANWHEASVICKEHDGVLALLDNQEKAMAVSKIMSYSNIQMADMWIGGYQKSGSHPPWPRNLEKCLVIDKSRRKNNAIFVNCYLPKPFICERDIDSLAKLPPKTIVTNTSIFYFYHQKLNWNEAVAFCRLRNYRLAVILDTYTSKSIARLMLKSRPTVETAWIGSHEFGKKWVWVSTGKEVDDSHNDSGNNYLWSINSFNQKHKCGAFDRHVHKYTFIRKKCSKKLPFICEKYSKEIVDKPTTEETPKPNAFKYCEKLSLILFHEELNWKEAFEFCQSQNYYLGEIREKHTLDCISDLMKEEDISHLWLAGKYMGKCKLWQWKYSHFDISTHSTSVLVPWSGSKQIGDDCLNLDYNFFNGKSEAYGLNCDQKQSFLCMGPRDDWLVNDENECV